MTCSRRRARDDSVASSAWSCPDEGKVATSTGAITSVPAASFSLTGVRDVLAAMYTLHRRGLPVFYDLVDASSDAVLPVTRAALLRRSASALRSFQGPRGSR